MKKKLINKDLVGCR